MLLHRGARELLVLGRVLLAQDVRALAAHVGGVVALERIMRARLVGERLGQDAARVEAAQKVDDVAEPADGNAVVLAFPRLRGQLERAVDRDIDVLVHLVEVAVVDALLEPLAADVGDEAGAFVHRDRQGLRAAHAAAAARHIQRAAQRTAEVLARAFCEGLVGALQNPLRADVDPRARGHLAEHHQALRCELVELRLRGPVRHEVRVRDEDAR